MNFTTDLPKRNPLVSYIVASAVKCEKFFPGNKQIGPAFRMHAVILKSKSLLASPHQSSYLNPERIEDYPKSSQLFICCHVRKCDENEAEEGEPTPGKKMGYSPPLKNKKERHEDGLEDDSQNEEVYFRSIRKIVRNENEKPSQNSLAGNKRSRR